MNYNNSSDIKWEKQINLVMCPWTLESDYQDLKVSLTTS